MNGSAYVGRMSTTCTLPRVHEVSSSADGAGDLDQLARSIADTGIARHERAVRRFAHQLRGRFPDRRSAVLLDVMTDPEQPCVARERAFGYLHSLSLTTQGSVGRQAA